MSTPRARRVASLVSPDRNQNNSSATHRNGTFFVVTMGKPSLRR
jgi:hypothetical protein